MANIVIEWYGLSCLKITAKQTVGEVSVLTDPFGADHGIKMPRAVEADLVLVTDPAEASEVPDRVGNKPFVVSHPGEYESKGVFVYGFPLSEVEIEGKRSKPTRPCSFYRIEIDDFSIAHLGCINRQLTDAEYDKLADVDILILPVGDKGTALSAGDAVEIMTRLEPRVVIPTHWKQSGLTDELDTVDRFLKESGLAPERVERLKLAKKDLPQDETKLYVLTA